VLLVNGDRAPVTPPDFGRRAARYLTRSLHLVDPYNSHEESSPCVEGTADDFCSLFQAEALDIKEPWYCFTPTDCHWISPENYIFVNALTGAVRLFPSDGSPAGLGVEAQEQPSA
jgi:hypothetical protein